MAPAELRHLHLGAQRRHIRSSQAQPSMTAVDVIEPSYNLALGASILGAGLLTEAKLLADRQVLLTSEPEVDTKRVGIVNIAKLGSLIVGVPIALFGLFLAFQTTTLRFTFDDTSFSLVKADMSSTGENVVVGGENRWAYDKFVNFDFFPGEGFPILVYFKETQTAKEQWNVGPGEQANSPEAIAKGAKPGQVHFFPAIANVAQIKAEFQKHGCAKI
mmetsp:Transcript_3854/g.7386  ORF Transcript_3854/g.7386 Transcript_3854/m.7386 type:complete len:217 (+) Transcript_3854:31-681(+)